MNYTKQMEQALIDSYTNKTVDNDTFIKNILQEEMFSSLTVKSIRSKLVSMKIYEQEEKRSTKSSVDKKTLIAEITRLTNADADTMDGLKNASKPALTIILESLNDKH